MAGRDIDREAVTVWEIVATVRWAVIALQQGARFTSGAEPTLELALTGRMIAGLEQDLLELVVRAASDGGTAGLEQGGSGVGSAGVPADSPGRGAGRSKAGGAAPGTGFRAPADLPAGPALLGAARTALLEELLPRLPDESRYTASMIANAMSIAARELEGSEPDERAIPLVDGTTALFEPALLDRMRGDVRRRLTIAEPKRLATVTECAGR